MKVIMIADFEAWCDRLVAKMQTPEAKAATRRLFEGNLFVTNIKPHVTGQVHFQYYKDGALWYKTSTTDFIFPVPIEDIGSATFNAEDKALLFMRYIRKHLETIKSAEQEIADEGKNITG